MNTVGLVLLLLKTNQQLPTNLSSVKKNRVCWVNSGPMCRVGVRTIGGSSYLWRPELPPSTPAPDIYIPVDTRVQGQDTSADRKSAFEY